MWNLHLEIARPDGCINPSRKYTSVFFFFYNWFYLKKDLSNQLGTSFSVSIIGSVALSSLCTKSSFICRNAVEVIIFLTRCRMTADWNCFIQKHDEETQMNIIEYNFLIKLLAIKCTYLLNLPVIPLLSIMKRHSLEKSLTGK